LKLTGMTKVAWAEKLMKNKKMNTER